MLPTVLCTSEAVSAGAGNRGRGPSSLAWSEQSILNCIAAPQRCSLQVAVSAAP